MKKRITALISATILVVGCFGTVAAKDSDKKSLIEKYEDPILTPDEHVLLEGDTDDYSIKSYLEDDDEYDAEYSLGHLLAQHPEVKNKIVSIFNIKSDDADENEPVEAKIVLNSIKDSKDYSLYHMDPKTGIWDTTGVTVKTAVNGVLTVSVKGGGPVAVVSFGKKTATTGAAASTGLGSGATTRAPKTGEV